MLLLADEEQYQDGDMIGKDEDGKFYKGVVMFQIIGLRKNIPIVIKAVPETTISWQLLKKEIEECVSSLNKQGFKVRGVITDDHSSNVAAFSNLIDVYRFDPNIHGVKFPSNFATITYLFFLFTQKMCMKFFDSSLILRLFIDCFPIFFLNFSNFFNLSSTILVHFFLQP